MRVVKYYFALYGIVFTLVAWDAAATWLNVPWWLVPIIVAVALGTLAMGVGMVVMLLTGGGNAPRPEGPKGGWDDMDGGA